MVMYKLFPSSKALLVALIFVGAQSAEKRIGDWDGKPHTKQEFEKNYGASDEWDKAKADKPSTLTPKEQRVRAKAVEGGNKFTKKSDLDQQVKNSGKRPAKTTGGH